MKRKNLTVALTAALAITGAGHAAAADVPPLPTTLATALGWSAALHRSNPDAPRKLVMVPPSGGILPIGKVGSGADIQDVTPDGSFVIVTTPTKGGTLVHVWDTHERAHHTFTLDHARARLHFGGEGILQMPQTDSAEKTFVLRGYDGAIKQEYAASAIPKDWTPFAAVAPKGKTVVESADRLVVRDAASGSVHNRIRMPEPQGGSRRCVATRPLGDQAVLVECGVADSGSTDARYRVSLADGQATRLAGAPGTGVWPVNSGYAFLRSDSADESWRIKSKGGTKVLDLAAEGTTVHGSAGNGLHVLQHKPTTYLKPGALYRYDVSTDARTELAGTEATGGGTITHVQVIDGRH